MVPNRGLSRTSSGACTCVCTSGRFFPPRTDNARSFLIKDDAPSLLTSVFVRANDGGLTTSLPAVKVVRDDIDDGEVHSQSLLALKLLRLEDGPFSDSLIVIEVFIRLSIGLSDSVPTGTIRLEDVLSNSVLFVGVLRLEGNA